MEVLAVGREEDESMEKEMSDNKMLQAIDYLEAQKRLFPKSFNVLSGHFDTAISALREQAEREKGCEYCNSDALDSLILTKFCGRPEAAMHGGNCPIPEDERPKFCPMCGRDYLTFTIQGELPSLNEYIHAINRNRHIGNKMKQDTQEAIQWAIRAQIKSGYEITQPVTIRFLWASRTAKKDIDNVAFAKKFILDAIVTMGILPNDTRKWVKGFTDEFIVDRKNPRTEVEIKSYEQ